VIIALIINLSCCLLTGVGARPGAAVVARLIEHVLDQFRHRTGLGPVAIRACALNVNYNIYVQMFYFTRNDGLVSVSYRVRFTIQYTDIFFFFQRNELAVG